MQEVFDSKFVAGLREVDFERADLERAAEKLRISLPKNLGDVL